MDSFSLHGTLIENVEEEAVSMVRSEMGQDLKKIILYGSCARGDYSQDSDVDIALLTACDRLEAKKYSDVLSAAATSLALKYAAIVNFVCLPQKEFDEKKDWYPYFKNIEKDGKVLYG